VVPPDSQQIPRARCYSGALSNTAQRVFAYGGLTLYADPFQRPSANTPHHIRNPSGGSTTMSHNTHTATPAGLTRYRFSLFRFRSPLLTESQLFSLPAGTEMFHFPAFPPHTLFYSDVGDTPLLSGCRVAPFGNPRITARLTTPRGISQSSTSFIGS
jgi:hypothetical protein